MDFAVLAIKAALALMLVIAGSAKLVDLRGLAATIQVFSPRSTPNLVLRGIAVSAGLAELLLGTISFAFPELAWVNVVVFGAACVFLLLSTTGYIFHRDVPCSCFGRLSPRVFDALTLARSAGVACLAAVVAVADAVSAPGTRVTIDAHVLLLATAILLCGAAATAARALASIAEAKPALPVVMP